MINDTCDRCGPGVAAWVHVSFVAGGDLFWCGHCADQHMPAIDAMPVDKLALRVDEREERRGRAVLA